MTDTRKKVQKPPKQLVIRGTACELYSEKPVEVVGQHWDTYAPMNDDDDRRFERSRETGRIVQTRP